MVCAFGGLLGLQPSLHVGRPLASWRLGDDELLLATTRSSKGTKAATTSTLNSPTTVSPSPLPPSKTSALPTKNLPPQKAVANKVKMDYALQMFLLTPNGTSSSHAAVAAAAVSQQEQSENLYLGYETWLPVAPKVKNKKPRTIYNAESLAYLGDCIYELYARRHFLFPPLALDEYNSRVMAVVRCETQDMLLKKLLKDGFLTDDERDVVRWGKNVQSGKTKAIKRVGVSTYKRASSLETLGLYVTGDTS
ncbi:uncharacterized protein LOC116256747 isoform X2 [Nymphaea colorata]|uniref:uncharacterized protein LOC116256747 isoform X2 n=1 Tax=Nymphaea colorata TaxID=210225 RepID=UPI00129D4A3D|nr:uncharacterized protein LOC116256747 isoform X2 [Nymphaea colorata]